MRLLRTLVALAAGGLLPLAFAPIHLWWLAFISPTIALLLWQRNSPRDALWYGWCFGLGLFGVGSSWVYISIHHFGNANVLLSSIITMGFVALLALFPALQGYLLRKYWHKASLWTVCLLAFPAEWVLFEYLRSFLLDGFPFLFLGYTQLHTWFGGIAPIAGVYGISLTITWICGAIALIIHPDTKRLTRWLALLLIVFLTGASLLLKQQTWTKQHGHSLQVSLIQGNISQSVKWDPNELYNILSRYRQLTNQAWHSDIIVWPEAAVPFYPSDLPNYFKALAHSAQQHQATVIVGAPIQDSTSTAVFNGLLAIGVDHGYYNKRHLVPFGEYIPLEHVFGRIMHFFKIPLSSLAPGHPHQPTLYLHHIPTAAFICYETAFPQEALHAMQGKQFAVNIVDDAWFGHSFAAAQQFQMTAMRALETGRYFAVTANTGITAIINPKGQITGSLPRDQTGILTGHIYAMTGQTPLMRLSYLPLFILLILMAGISYLLRRD